MVNEDVRQDLQRAHEHHHNVEIALGATVLVLDVVRSHLASAGDSTAEQTLRGLVDEAQQFGRQAGAQVANMNRTIIEARKLAGES